MVIAPVAKEALNKLIPFMVRQAHHERNQQLTVRPEPVEGFNQRFPKKEVFSGL
jgi:glycerol-3-phosphate dehydrogenase (NAD(P)+)